MSALPSKAEITKNRRDVGYVPIADFGPLHSSTSSASEQTERHDEAERDP
jgi:hypothetical protein